MSIQIPLGEELERKRDRVHVLPSVVAERAAALRYRLDRVDEDLCDAYTTPETPGFEPGVPFEVKSVRVLHHDGIGRLGVRTSTHAELLEAEGWYVIAVYDELKHAGADRILALAIEAVPAYEVDRWITEGCSPYQKVRWNLVLNPDRHGVDLGRWDS